MKLNQTPVYFSVFIGSIIWLLLLWICITNQASWYSHGADYWEHSASINVWMKNFWSPTNHRFAIEMASVRNTPYFAIIVLLSRWLDFTAIQAMTMSGIIASSVFVIAASLFANRYFRNPWAGPVALIVFLCGWGSAWYWTNVYQLRDLLFIISYPSFFVFSFSLLIFWFALGTLRANTLSYFRLVNLAVLVAFVFASHPPTGTFAIAGLLLLSAFDPGLDINKRFYVTVAVAFGFFLSFLWPFYSLWGLLSGSGAKLVESSEKIIAGAASWGLLSGKAMDSVETSESLVAGVANSSVEFSRAQTLIETDPFYDFSQVMDALGPGLFAIPILIYLIWKKEHLFLWTGALSMLFVYILNLLIAVPLGYRFLIFCIFYLQMALIYGVLQVFSRHEKRVRLRYILRGMTIMFLLLIVFWNVNLLAKDLNRIAKKQQTIVARMEPLKAVIPPDAVVMVRNRIGWPLPTFTGKTIGAMRETHLYFEKNSRNKDVSIFFSDEVSLSKRLSIMRKYGASYIIFSTAGENSAVKQQLLSIPGEYFEVGEYTVIKVHL